MPPLERVADRPTWLLNQASAHAHALLADAFAAHGMRGYHFRVLAALDQYGASSQAEVGRRTGIDRSDVVATVNELVARGLARRAPDRDDRRRNVITITARGRTTLTQVDTSLDEVQRELLAPLTEPEQRTLVRLLRKLT